MTTPKPSLHTQAPIIIIRIITREAGVCLALPCILQNCTDLFSQVAEALTDEPATQGVLALDQAEDRS